MKKTTLILTAFITLLTACKKLDEFIKSKVKDVPSPTAAPDFTKDGDITSITSQDSLWLEQVAKIKSDSLAKTTADSTSLFHKKNMMVAIVEVNSHFFSNVACYKDQNENPIFDLAFPFSDNIQIDPVTRKPCLHLNENCQAVREKYVQAVQKAGIKVGLSILGNWDTAGVCNFRTFDDAAAYARLVAFAVRKYKLDAVMTDDEYSKSVADADPNSYVMLMSEIKRLLPDIFLCYYSFGGGYGSYNGKKMGDYCDAIFAPFYPSDAPTGTYNFSAGKSFSAASETGGGFKDALSRAKKSVKDGEGGIMFYDVRGLDSTAAFYAPYALGLKGISIKTPVKGLNADEYDGINK